MTYSSGRMLLSSQREGQVSRFNVWVAILVPLLALLFQIYVPLFFRFLNFLEMPLLVVVYLGLMRRNPVSGLLVGAAVGLAQDAWSKNPLGMFGITKTLVGYFAASIGMKLDVDNVLMRFILAFFFYVFHQSFYWVMEHALLSQQSPFDLPGWLGLGVLNALVGAALFHSYIEDLKQEYFNICPEARSKTSNRRWPPPF
jgi:rod shape-determining protein MreD